MTNTTAHLDTTDLDSSTSTNLTTRTAGYPSCSRRPVGHVGRTERARRQWQPPPARPPSIRSTRPHWCRPNGPSTTTRGPSSADSASVGEWPTRSTLTLMTPADGSKPCPARALIIWQRQLIRTGHTNATLFRFIDRHDHIGRCLSRQAIPQLVKDHTKAIGLDPDPYGAHSLRAGYVTDVSETRVGDATIQRPTRHRSRDSLARQDGPGLRCRNNGLAGEFW